MGVINASQIHELFLSARHDLDTDALKLALMDENHVPSLTSQNNWNQISANECSGTGYTAGGKALTGVSLTYDVNGNITLEADDVTWTSLDVGEISYAVLVNTTPGVYHVLAWWEVDKTVEGEDFVVRWNTDGVLTASAPVGVYKAFFQYSWNADIDLVSDTLKMMLVSGYNPDRVSDVKYSDVSSHEVSGSGYTAGGVEVSIPTVYAHERRVEPDQAFYTFESDEDVEWASLGSNTPSHAILYDNTHADKPLLMYFPVSAEPEGGPYALLWADDVPDPIYPASVEHDDVIFFAKSFE